MPDVMQRVHWDPEFARRAGNPTTFDYGRMRETWLIHLCTDWMGDDAWLWKLDCEFRRFNYVGDTQWLAGRVARKYLADGERPAVDLELRAENQRGEVTTPGHATILLAEPGARRRSAARSARRRDATCRAPSARSQPTSPTARRHRCDERRAYRSVAGLGVDRDGAVPPACGWTGRSSATPSTTT